MSETRPADPGTLPDWYAMSELDRGIALVLVWEAYAQHLDRHGHEDEPHPDRYSDADAALAALDHEAALEHARHVTGGWQRAQETLGEDEVDRLYRLAHTSGAGRA